MLPDRGYFELSPPGNVTVENDAATLFRPAKDGQGLHSFLEEPNDEWYWEGKRINPAELDQ